jgi:PAS domain S-box-containing protein
MNATPEPSGPLAEAILEAVVGRVCEGMVLSDAQGRLAIYNAQMEALTGYSRGEAEDCADFLKVLYPEPEVHRRVLDGVYEVLATGHARHWQAPIRTKAGARRTLSVRMSPVELEGQTWLLSTYQDLADDAELAVTLFEKERQVQGFNHALAVLAGGQALFSGDRQAAVRAVLETAARTLEADRVSAWFFDAGREALLCEDLYVRVEDNHATGGRLLRKDYPVYFQSLLERGVIAASVAQTDPATRELAEGYLVPLHVESLLDVPIHAGGQIIGVVCHEHVGATRVWTADEQAFATGTAHLLSLAVEASARQRAEEAHAEANRQWQQIIEFLPDATFVIDAQGVVVAWNKAIESLTGVPKSDMLGRGDHAYAVPFYGVRRPILIDLAISPGVLGEKAYDAIERDGSAISGETFVPQTYSGKGAYLWGTARPLYDETGRVTGAIESIRDITTRKQGEREVAAWKRRYELVAVASGQATYEYDPASGHILWGESVGRVLGYGREEIGEAHENWMRLMHPDDRGPVERTLRECDRTHAPFVAEYRLQLRKGGYHWFRDCGYYTTNADGTPCMVGMLADIEVAKQAEALVQRAQEELELRVRQRTEQLARSNERLRAEAVERSRTQRALAASEQKYRALVDSLPQVVFEMDMQGNLLLLNREGYQAGGLTPAMIAQGIHFMDLVAEEDRPRVVANWRRIVSGEHRTTTGERYTFVRRDGTSFPARSYAQTILQDGRAVGVTGFLIDETERLHQEEELRRAHAQLEDRVAQRTAELAASNDSLRRLLDTQEMNIALAHEVLQLVNSESPRHTPLPGGESLFCAALLAPRHIEGGDHYFVRHVEVAGEAHTLVSLKDQSGHEVGCLLRSIITDLLHQSLIARQRERFSLEELVGRLNQEVCRSHLFSDGEFFTALNLDFDHATRELRYVVAGNPPALLVRGTTVRQLPEPGAAGGNLPVGMLSGIRFSAGTVKLEAGDRLILYTDGLLDLPRRRGGGSLSSAELPELLGRLLAERADGPVVHLAWRLLHEISGEPFAQILAARDLPDDLAMLVLELEPPLPVTEDCVQAADVEDLHRARSRLVDAILAEWAQHRVEVSALHLQMVMEEALLNAWRHGNRESPEKRIRVRRTYGNDACIEVIDEGEGFDWSQISDPTAHENRAKPSGRGLFLLRRFAGEARWSDAGRHLTLYFAREASFALPAGRSVLPRFDLWPAPATQSSHSKTP